ncbi:MAG: ribonuclease HI [Acidobacteria bacterium]|nr:ribonuclease HI [Acidobacteriota bacterium]
MADFTIHTDGACSGNPGPGGYGYIITGKGARKESSAGYKKTTNNRMELLAVIKALETIDKGSSAEIWTDSKYIADAINARWLAKWKTNGWKTANKKPVKNQDLWRMLDEQISRINVVFKWLQGHNGHPYNEYADSLARRAIENPQYIDKEFENQNNPLGLDSF